MALPQSVFAADIGLSCVLTEEEIVFVPRASSAASSGTLSVQRPITEKADLTIKQSVLITPAGSPCDRISGGITNTNIDVSCSFPPEGIGRATIKIQVDLKRGTITETWDMIEHDGSQSHSYKHGTCTAGEAPRVVDRSSPASEPSLRLAARQTTFLRAGGTGSKSPSLH